MGSAVVMGATSAQALLNALAEFLGLGTEFVVAEFLNLRLKGVDGRTFGISALMTRSFLVPKTLPSKLVNQTGNPSRAARPKLTLKA